MKKILLFTLIILVALTPAFPQEVTPEVKKDVPAGKIQFEKTHHDFGAIKEADGPVTYKFQFTNTGSAPLKLTKVQPGCGCTASDWTKEEVKPGGTGFVSATYDVNGRPGKFSKSVTVHTDGDPAINIITFSGEVLERIKTFADSFPYTSGNLRMQEEHINFGRVGNNIKDTVQYLNVINTGTTPITIKEMKAPEGGYITTESLPFVIAPGQRAKFPIHYDLTKAKDFGLLFDIVKLVTDDPALADKQVNVIADVNQYFPPLTDAEKAKAPKAVFQTTSHDFGEIKQGTVASGEFIFTNMGKQELHILKVKPSCGCTASHPEKDKLKPGESSKLKFSYNSEGKSGQEEKYITVYTNDPLNPEINLKLKANVITPEQSK